MATTDFPNVNGNEYSFASVRIEIGGVIYNKFKSITYGESLEPGQIDVNAVIPGGWTRGKWSADDISLEMPKSEADAMITDLGEGFGRRVLQIFVSYAEEDMPTITDELPACRISKVADNPGGGGDEPAATTFTLKQLLPGLRNGVRIVELPVAA